MRSIASNHVSGEALVDAAEHGETVIVTRDGVPIGEFVPRSATTPKETPFAERWAEFRRKHPPDPEFADILEEVHRELNEHDAEVREW